jgi:hypothetical protein
MPIDWIKDSELALGGVITLSVSFISIFLHNRITKYGIKKRDDILFELAVLRGEGVKIRNEGEKGELPPEVLEGWLDRATVLEQAILDKAKQLSKVESKRLQYLGRVQAIQYNNIWG